MKYDIRGPLSFCREEDIQWQIPGTVWDMVIDGNIASLGYTEWPYELCSLVAWLWSSGPLGTCLKRLSCLGQ